MDVRTTGTPSALGLVITILIPRGRALQVVITEEIEKVAVQIVRIEPLRGQFAVCEPRIPISQIKVSIPQNVNLKDYFQ